MDNRIAFLRQETLSGRNKPARCAMPAFDVSREPGSLPVRKALGFQTICRNMPLYIGPGELIVGTRTFYNFQDDPRSNPLAAYPKYVNDEDIARFGGDFSGINSQHYTPDLGILLEKGIGGIIEAAENRKADQGLQLWHLDFLDSVILAYTGLGCLISRYADHAQELSDAADSPEEKERLLSIARCCRHISAHRPRNFREAVQLLWFGHLGTILESGLFINYGRLDVILQPHLGDTPREEALELIACLLLKMYDQADIEDNTYLIRHEGQLVVTLGGLLPDGENAVEEVTMLFLDAIDLTRLPEPEFNLRVSVKNPPEYLDRAARLTISGCNFLSYYNDDTIIPALVSAGLAPEDARCYGFDLCQDLNIPGKSDFFCSANISLTHELMDFLQENREFEDFGQLLTAFKAHMAQRLHRELTQEDAEHANMLLWREGRFEEYLANVRSGISGHWDWRHPMCPLPYLSGLFHGTIENAADMIFESYPIKHRGAIVGTAVECVNSLAAISKVVYDDRLYTLEDVLQACREDYRGEGQEILRSLLWKAPKWGNDDSYVDTIAKDLIEFCLKQIGSYTCCTGGRLLSGVHQPHPVPTGQGLMATPEGRHKGQPAAVTMTPESGTMNRGATAALKSASVFDPMLLQWNYCVMINYYASIFAGPKGKDIFRNLLTSYFARGGVQHQPNVMDAEQLRQAQITPEKYKDLVVRLWGVSAHFVDLPRELQDEMIARLS